MARLFSAILRVLFWVCMLEYQGSTHSIWCLRDRECRVIWQAWYRPGVDRQLDQPVMHLCNFMSLATCSFHQLGKVVLRVATWIFVLCVWVAEALPQQISVSHSAQVFSKNFCFVLGRDFGLYTRFYSLVLTKEISVHLDKWWVVYVNVSCFILFISSTRAID